MVHPVFYCETTESIFISCVSVSSVERSERSEDPAVRTSVPIQNSVNSVIFSALKPTSVAVAIAADILVRAIAVDAVAAVTLADRLQGPRFLTPDRAFRVPGIIKISV